MSIKENCIKVLMMSCIIFYTINVSANNFASVEIQIQDKDFLERGTRLRISVYDDYYSQAYLSFNSSSEHKLMKEKQRFILVLPSDLCYLKIEVIDDDAYFPAPGNIYLIESQDSLKFTLKQGNIYLGGKGNKKNILKGKLRSLGGPVYLPWFNEYIDNQDFKGYLNAMKYNSLHLGKTKIQYLEKNKDMVDDKVYSVLLQDCIAFENLSFLQRISGLRKGSLKKLFFPFLKSSFESLYSDKSRLDAKLYSGKSYEYIDYLYNLELENVLINDDNADSLNKPRLDFGKLYDNIKERYKGKLRDQLILIAYSEMGTRVPISKSIILDAINVVEDPIVLKGLESYNNKFYENSPMYPFVLIDTLGNKYDLQCFNGKMVVMDFWFNGCIGCIGLAQALEPIRDDFKDNDEIEFITVNVDSSREKWIRGIKTGKYTGDGINLQVDGLGVNNSLLRYFEFSSYPQLVIFDKSGFLISANPSRPSLQSKAKTEEFKNLLKDNL